MPPLVAGRGRPLGRGRPRRVPAPACGGGPEVSTSPDGPPGASLSPLGPVLGGGLPPDRCVDGGLRSTWSP
eukprot:3523779-Alexandrium_andersonii.AAC.1